MIVDVTVNIGTWGELEALPNWDGIPSFTLARLCIRFAETADPATRERMNKRWDLEEDVRSESRWHRSGRLTTGSMRDA